MGMATLRENKARLIRDICSAKNNGSIKILVGELNTKVYNDPCVLAAFIGAAKRGIKIQVIAGPVIMIDKPPRIDGVKNTIAKLIERMNSAKEKAKIIVAGEPTAKVFRSPYFLAALAGIRSRGVKLKISTGPPVVVFDEKVNKFNTPALYGKRMKREDLEKVFEKKSGNKN
jgi:hypothetical protein